MPNLQRSNIHYAGRIKVVTADNLCFAVDPKTLQALGCSTYDPYPYLPGEGAVEIISTAEWHRRCGRGAAHA